MTERVARRVQRPTSQLPLVHLESALPAPGWTLAVTGLVDRPSRWTLESLQGLPVQERVWDLHCVWGWTRPRCRWEGAAVEAVLDEAIPLPEARYALVRSASGAYESCLTLHEVTASLLSWRLDGDDLPPEHGGPLRLVPPPTKWGYKGVKWAAEIRLLDRPEPGFWERLVGDTVGDVPAELLDLRDE